MSLVAEIRTKLLETAADVLQARSAILYRRTQASWSVLHELEREVHGHLRHVRHDDSPLADECNLSRLLTDLAAEADRRHEHIFRACNADLVADEHRHSTFVALRMDDGLWGILCLVSDQPVADQNRIDMVLSLCDMTMVLLKHAQHYRALSYRGVATEESMDGMAVLIDDRFVYLNRAHATMFGYDNANDLLGESWRTLYPAEQISWFEEHVFPELLQQGSWRGETVGRRRDGTTFAEEVTLIVHCEGPLVCICRDISERITAENTIRTKSLELEQYSRLLESRVQERTAELALAMRLAERANEVKGFFLANMTHELRTPLNGILGMLHLLEGTNPTLQQSEYIGIAQSSGRHLLALISDVLDFSRIDAGKLELYPTAVQLQDLVEEVMEMNADASFRKGLEIYAEFDPALPVFVQIDERRLRQILLNLINNAIKFTDSGEIAVRAYLAPLNRLIIEVSDTGHGMSREQQVTIFDAFSQVDNASTRRHGGSGLGLSICRGIIGAMGGVIEVDSTPQIGTTFRVGLPLTVSQEPWPASLPLNPLAVTTAIVVDPHPGSRLVLTQALQSLGLYVVSASDLDSASSAFAQAMAGSVLFLDHSLFGIQSRDDLRHLPNGSECKWVLLTPLGQPSPPRAARFQWHAQLTKPIRCTRLRALLNSLVGSEAGLDQAAESQTNSLQHSDYHGHILVVDDVESNIRVLCAMLNRHGCTTDFVRDGLAAIKAVRCTRYDMVMMDCQMPMMDGLDATRQIRMFDTAVPIIAVTASVTTGDETKCFAAGMNGFLAKPINPVKLEQCLATWCKSGPVVADKLQLNHADEPESRSDNARIVDIEHVRMLKGSIVREDFRKLIESYFVDTTNGIMVLRTASAEGRLNHMIREAHRLKGASATLGVVSLAVAFAELEQLLRQDAEQDKTALMIERIVSELDQAEAEITRIVND